MNIYKSCIEYADIITGDSIEKVIVESVGGIHLGDCNGADGYYEEKKGGYSKWIEVKSQIYTGRENATLLMGRGKYSRPTYGLWEKKMDEGEWVYVVGLDKRGNCYYIFEFPFLVVSDMYRERIGWSTYDMLPKHYMGGKGFSVCYIADRELLEGNREKFQKKFYRKLIELLGMR